MHVAFVYIRCPLFFWSEDYMEIERPTVDGFVCTHLAVINDTLQRLRLAFIFPLTQDFLQFSELIRNLAIITKQRDDNVDKCPRSCLDGIDETHVIIQHPLRRD